MRALVRQAMKEGAMGVGSSLIYAPATYAETPELTAITSEAARCGGMYISHIRDEGPKGVRAQVQGDELRVSSKKKDDLQAVIALVKGNEFGLALQFVNFR